MLEKYIDTAISPIARVLQYDYVAKPMKPLGTNNTMKIARAYNRLVYGRYYEFRKDQYLRHFDELTRENGAPVLLMNEIKDGWALDTSGTLPHLKQLLLDAGEIIKERGGVKRTDFGRPWFQELPIDDLFDKYPSLLDFATSSDVLSTVCKHLGFIPVLSAAVPHGLRFNESWAAHDDAPPGYFRGSQLFHIDYHDSPMAYVIVLLNDITMENGPFCFMPDSVSQKVTKAVGYRKWRKPHRLSDDEVYSVVPESELIKVCYPAGTVLFFDPSRCFHFGSRNAVKPRYALMYAFVSPCRTDFTEVLLDRKLYPVRDNDSRLRKMVLRREYTG
ncbi:MAG: phytanoyl-CoA dioxygenase family protein [Thermodesulfobacteriota bacterium]